MRDLDLVNETKFVHELFLVYFVNFIYNFYISVSQTPGRGPVPGPGINYTGSWEARGNHNMLQDLISPVDN